MSKTPKEKPKVYLYRQDDNNNKYLIGRYSIAKANQLKAKLERKKHKQTYWVEENLRKDIIC